MVGLWMAFRSTQNGSSLWFESSDGYVIHNLFNFLHIIFQGIKLLAETVVLEVEEAKPSGDVRDECRDIKRSLVVSKDHTVHCQPGLQ